jgi:hypothetical protein
MNLTLHDWKTVFAFVDKHPHLSQSDIVQHFATLTHGRLIFTQSTLSRKLANRSELEKRELAYPSALSSKRIRIVTRPDVEKALILWVYHMEQKGESVTGPMLSVKRTKFEEKMNVPAEERLTTNGWVQSFCKT